jgi:hypothetical protein
MSSKIVSPTETPSRVEHFDPDDHPCEEQGKPNSTTQISPFTQPHADDDH